MKEHNFEALVRKIARPKNWHPTPDEIIQFSKLVAVEKPERQADLQALLSKEFGRVICSLEEGIDNSDLATLIILASELTGKKND